MLRWRRSEERAAVQLKELNKCCVCVCVCCLCAFELNICKQVCVHAELYAYCVWYSMFLCTHINRCQSTQCFHFTCPLKLLLPHPKQEENSHFYFDSHLQKSCLLHFYTGSPSAWMALVVKGGTVGERMQMEERIRPRGPRCALCVRHERKKEETSLSKMSLFVPKWLVCQPELQWFCASGSTRSALLTHIHPGPYHLEDIMGNAWRGSLTPPKDSPVARRVKCSSNQLVWTPVQGLASSVEILQGRQGTVNILCLGS